MALVDDLFFHNFGLLKKYIFPFTASDNVDAFQTCIDANVFNGLDDCHEECAPTFAMLASSEMPTTFEFDNFGAGSDNAGDKPASSICEA